MPALQDNTLAYVYDDYGNRTKKTVNNADINYYINNGITVLNELDNAGNVTKTIVKGVGQIGEIDKDGNIFYTHQDALGSTILVTNQFGAVVQQYEYDPFGQIIGQAGLNDTSDTNYTYTNQEWDTESELYYYNARYYNPALGRFISRDTVLGQDGDILSRNLYIYVKNNPLKYVDPSGETTEAILRELKTSEKIWQYAVGAGEALSDIAYGSLDMLKNGIIMQQNPMLGLYNNISKGLALSENVYNNREQIISSVVNLKNNIIGGVPLSDPYWNDLSREEKGYWATQGAVAVGGGYLLRGPKLYGVDPAMAEADMTKGTLINGSYIKNPTATNLVDLISDNGKIGTKEMSGRYMYVIDPSDNVIIGKRHHSSFHDENGILKSFSHPTLIGGTNPQVQSAGIVEIRGNSLYSVDNASGHFKPGNKSLNTSNKIFGNLPDSTFAKDFQGYLSW